MIFIAIVGGVVLVIASFIGGCAWITRTLVRGVLRIIFGD